MVKSEVSQMCVDLKEFLETDKEYILSGSRIGYKVMDDIAYDVVKGYQTAYAYLQEASKGHLPDESNLQKALALRIPCGRFHYANLGSSPKILGVSGTIEALGDYEWTVMKQFGIRSYTLVPSVYGRNNFAFLNQKSGMPITISTDQEHCFDIFTQAGIACFCVGLFNADWTFHVGTDVFPLRSARKCKKIGRLSSSSVMWHNSMTSCSQRTTASLGTRAWAKQLCSGYWISCDYFYPQWACNH